MVKYKEEKLKTTTVKNNEMKSNLKITENS